MKNILLWFLLPCLSGCAYLHDRGRDACDMVTLAAEAKTVNASFQVSKCILGFGLAHGPGVGLRSGTWGIFESGEINAVLSGFKLLVPSAGDQERHKGYDYSYSWIPWEHEEENFFGTYEKGEWFNAFQVEVAAGLGIGARAGVNLAEILDFILGWTTLDICKDDIQSLKRRKASEEP